MNAKLVLLIPVGDSDLPGFGGGVTVRPENGGGPIYHPGHPDHGLPSVPVDPGFGGGIGAKPGHPANRPPNVPPNVIWPPQGPPPGAATKPPPPEISNGLPPTVNVPPGNPLPADSALVAVYTEKSGWSFSVVTVAQPKR